jgi:hypothetical protein
VTAPRRPSGAEAGCSAGAIGAPDRGEVSHRRHSCNPCRSHRGIGRRQEHTTQPLDLGRLPFLPQGGIDPLTALPIEVRYESSPYLQVGCLLAGLVGNLPGTRSRSYRRFLMMGAANARCTGAVNVDRQRTARVHSRRPSRLRLFGVRRWCILNHSRTRSLPRVAITA